MADVIDTNNQIPNGLTATKMRKSIENKNILKKKGMLYVGTGEKDTTDTEVCTTAGLEPGANDTYLVYDNTKDTGFTTRPCVSQTTATAILKGGDTSWSGSAKAWTQTLTITGVTADSINYIQPNAASEADYTNYAKAKIGDGGQADNSITLISYATSKPTKDIPIKITIVKNILNT